MSGNVAARTAASRARCGLPAKVSDPGALSGVAAVIAFVIAAAAQTDERRPAPAAPVTADPAPQHSAGGS